MHRQTLFRLVNLIIGGALLVGLLWLAMRSGGSLYYYLDLPSLILVAGFVLATMWLGHGPINTVVAVVEGLAARSGLDPKKRTRYAGMLRTAHRMSWTAGVLGLLMGMIIMMQNMDDPSKIGPGMAIGLLPVFYGGVLAECVFGAMHARLTEVGQTPPPDSDPPGDQSGTTGSDKSISPAPASHAALVVMMVFTMFLLLLVAMSEIKSEPEYNAVVGEVHQAFGMRGEKPSEQQPEHGSATEAEIREALREWLKNQ